MPTEDLANIVALVLCAWLGLLAVNVLYGMLSGSINMNRLLSHQQEQHSSAEKVVLLLTTLGFALYYTITALRGPLDPVDPSLPEISSDMLVALLGANGVYLTKKYCRLQHGGPKPCSKISRLIRSHSSSPLQCPPSSCSSA